MSSLIITSIDGGEGDSLISLFDTDSNSPFYDQPIAVPPGTSLNLGVRHASISPDGQYIFYGNRSTMSTFARVIDTATWEPITGFSIFQKTIEYTGFSNSGDYAFVCTEQANDTRGMWLYDVQDNWSEMSLPFHFNVDVHQAAFTPDDSKLVVCHDVDVYSTSITIIDTSDWSRDTLWKSDGGMAHTRIAVHPSGQLIGAISDTGNGSWTVYDIANNTVVATGDSTGLAMNGTGRAIDFSPDGAYMAVTGDTSHSSHSSIKLIRVSDWIQLWSKRFVGSPWDVAFSPDSSKVYTTGLNQLLYGYNTLSGSSLDVGQPAFGEPNWGARVNRISRAASLPVFSASGVTRDEFDEPSSYNVALINRETHDVVARVTSDPVTGEYSLNTIVGGEYSRIVFSDTTGGQEDVVLPDLIDRVLLE